MDRARLPHSMPGQSWHQKRAAGLSLLDNRCALLMEDAMHKDCSHSHEKPGNTVHHTSCTIIITITVSFVPPRNFGGTNSGLLSVRV